MPDVAPWQSRVGRQLSFPICLLLIGTDATLSRLICFSTVLSRSHLPNTHLVAAKMAAIPGLDMSMLTYSARLATFNTEHQLTKRRASTQKKKQASTASWPHESPSGEEVCLMFPCLCHHILTLAARPRWLFLQTRSRQRRQCPVFPLRRKTRRMGEPGCPPPGASSPLSALLLCA